MVGVAAYVYHDTGNAWAAAQTANPLANITENAVSSNPTVEGGLKATAKDVYGLTPIATAEWLTDAIGPRSQEVRYDPKLADKAIREGRNPFCAQCHGQGGALHPNAY
jgi:hypothetical protein